VIENGPHRSRRQLARDLPHFSLRVVAEQVQVFGLFVVQRGQEANLESVYFLVDTHQVGHGVWDGAITVDQVEDFVGVACALDWLIEVSHALKREAIVGSPFACSSWRWLRGVDVQSGDVSTSTSLGTIGVIVSEYLLRGSTLNYCTTTKLKNCPLPECQHEVSGNLARRAT
jgi:hypothetical protein